MEWPHELFDIFYLAMVRRKAVEELTARKIMTSTTMTAAFYANTNLDSKENQNKRQEIITELNDSLETNFREALFKIYGAKDPDAISDEIDMNDPFFGNMNLPQELMNELRKNS